MRVGIIVESEEVPAWVGELVKNINNYSNVQLAMVIQLASDPEQENTPFKLFRKFDSTLLPGKPNLFERVKVNLTAETPVILATPLGNENKNSMGAEDLAMIIKSQPDLILNFSSKSFHGEILELPKFGVCSLHFGDINRFGMSPAGFWEWYHNVPVSVVSILRHNNVPLESECLISTTTRTEYLSFSRNETALFSKGVDLLTNMVLRLADSGIQMEPMDAVQLNNHGLEESPDFWNSLDASVKLLSRAFIKSINKLLFLEQWVLFFSFNPQKFPQLNFQEVKALIPPKDRIWADPFVISKNGFHYVFIEELFRKTNRGHISCLVLNQAGNVEESRIIIERPYHLSYPYVFQHNDRWYMIPESGENKTVDLFECTEFPFQWKFKKSLLTDIEAFDSTLHFHEEKVWLFCTIKKSQGASTDDDLYLYYSHDLLNGDWKQHPKNPVVSNPSSARPAGRIFFHQNSWYRPSQICVPRYGYGLALNKIVELSDSRYEEEVVSRALPQWRRNLLSVHTLNFSESMMVIDGQLKRLKI